MNKTVIKAEVVAHSLNQQGDELISLSITFPRIILAEVNTHRMLSKNTSSSRAIPFKKMVEAVQNDPFIPIAWQKHHSGMQGNEYFTSKWDIIQRNNNWLSGRDSAISIATLLNEKNGVTKQLCNRLLEPFMWTTMLITGSQEGWNNFFELRCPQYSYIGLAIEPAKSKKEWLNNMQFSSALHPSQYPISDIEWLEINKGQAEIHMMDLAEKIYDAMNESTPEKLEAELQTLKSLSGSRERSLAITKLQECIMWLGMDLKRLNEPNPYPSSKDPSTGDKIEPTADNLKF